MTLCEELLFTYYRPTRSVLSIGHAKFFGSSSLPTHRGNCCYYFEFWFDLKDPKLKGVDLLCNSVLFFKTDKILIDADFSLASYADAL